MLEDRCVVFAPKSNASEKLCVECSGQIKADDSGQKCPKCRMPKCPNCQDNWHSETECRMLKSFLDNSGDSELWPEQELVSVLKGLAPLRLFLAQLQDESIRMRLDLLMDHLEDRTQVRSRNF